jgi:hypothetical protein
MNSAKMLGRDVHDMKKNTATCGQVNDRLRRRTKRIEKDALRKAVKAGTFSSLMTVKA